MTRRETVYEAIAHRNHGRVPFNIHLTAPAFESYGDLLFDRYVGKDLKTAYEEKAISKLNAVYLGIGNFLISVNTPWWRWANKPPEYSTSIEAPDYLPQTSGTGHYEGFRNEIKYLRENTDVYVLAMIYGSHFEKANDARGIENFLADMAGEPEFAQSMLDTIIRKNLVMLENLISYANIDGILLGSDWGSQQSLLMSPEIWRKMIAGGEKREYDLIKGVGKHVWIHSCGCVTSIIPDLIEMGVDVLNPVQPECMDVFKLKDDFGSRLTFFGGISTQRTLPMCSPAEIKTEVREIVEYMSRNGGYIASPAQEIQTDVSFENLCALIDTFRESA
jgi:uroporphyrinogen decarboxylase